MNDLQLRNGHGYNSDKDLCLSISLSLSLSLSNQHVTLQISRLCKVIKILRTSNEDRMRMEGKKSLQYIPSHFKERTVIFYDWPLTEDNEFDL